MSWAQDVEREAEALIEQALLEDLLNCASARLGVPVKLYRISGAIGVQWTGDGGVTLVLFAVGELEQAVEALRQITAAAGGRNAG